MERCRQGTRAHQVISIGKGVVHNPPVRVIWRQKSNGAVDVPKGDTRDTLTILKTVSRRSHRGTMGRRTGTWLRECCGAKRLKETESGGCHVMLNLLIVSAVSTKSGPKS